MYTGHPDPIHLGVPFGPCLLEEARGPIYCVVTSHGVLPPWRHEPSPRSFLDRGKPKPARRSVYGFALRISNSVWLITSGPCHGATLTDVQGHSLMSRLDPCAPSTSTILPRSLPMVSGPRMVTRSVSSEGGRRAQSMHSRRLLMTGGIPLAFARPAVNAA